VPSHFDWPLHVGNLVRRALGEEHCRKGMGPVYSPWQHVWGAQFLRREALLQQSVTDEWRWAAWRKKLVQLTLGVTILHTTLPRRRNGGSWSFRRSPCRPDLALSYVSVLGLSKSITLPEHDRLALCAWRGFICQGFSCWSFCWVQMSQDVSKSSPHVSSHVRVPHAVTQWQLKPLEYLSLPLNNTFTPCKVNFRCPVPAFISIGQGV